MNTTARLMSLLSLDAYNRGYNPGLSDDPNEVGVFIKVPGKIEGTYTHLSVGSNGFDTEIFKRN